MMNQLDAARKTMVESQVMTSGVTDQQILAAMESVPRERFVPDAKRTLAYLGDDLCVKEATTDTPDRFLMDPRVLAKLAELAALTPTDLVLDIGPATGYSTALLAQLADTVVAIECDSELAERASAILLDLGVDNAAVIEGPLADGNTKQGPFDVIFLNGSVPAVPEGLLDQLKDGGRLVAVVSEGNVGKARIYTRSGSHSAHRNSFDAGIHALPGFDVAKTFTF
jgi:protein-L-isoaspartate(D-aspartate) O-methyltransferase